jgi:hypothetical protein
LDEEPRRSDRLKPVKDNLPLEVVHAYSQEYVYLLEDGEVARRPRVCISAAAKAVNDANVNVAFVNQSISHCKDITPSREAPLVRPETLIWHSNLLTSLTAQ